MTKTGMILILAGLLLLLGVGTALAGAPNPSPGNNDDDGVYMQGAPTSWATMAPINPENNDDEDDYFVPPDEPLLPDDGEILPAGAVDVPEGELPGDDAGQENADNQEMALPGDTAGVSGSGGDSETLTATATGQVNTQTFEEIIPVATSGKVRMTSDNSASAKPVAKSDGASGVDAVATTGRPLLTISLVLAGIIIAAAILALLFISRRSRAMAPQL